MRVPAYPYSESAGFSLLELIVGIGVAGILMAVAVPGFNRVLPGLRLTQAARQVATDLQSARMIAISQNSTNTVTFNAGAGTYSPSLGSVSRNIGLAYPGITLSATANPVFTARGTASTTGTITLTAPGGSTQQVQVTAVGRVKIL